MKKTLSIPNLINSKCHYLLQSDIKIFPYRKVTIKDTNDVCIDLGNHTIKVMMETFGIIIDNCSNITIKNGNILGIGEIPPYDSNIGPQHGAIKICNSTNVSIENINVNNFQYGVVSNTVKDLLISNTSFQTISSVAIRLYKSMNVNVIGVSMMNCSIGIKSSKSQNYPTDLNSKMLPDSIINLTLNNLKTYNSPIVLWSVKGSIVTHMNMYFDAESNYNAIEIGTNDECCNDITIKNITISNINNSEGFDTVVVNNARNVIFDNIIISSNSNVEYVDGEIAYIPALIRLGSSQLNISYGYCLKSLKNYVEGVTIKNCQVNGLDNSPIGIYADSECKNIIIDNNKINALSSSLDKISASIFIASNTSNVFLFNNVCETIYINDKCNIEGIWYERPQNVVMNYNVVHQLIKPNDYNITMKENVIF
jgi:hypothetical protein